MSTGTELEDFGTPDKKRQFLHILVETGGNVTAACRSIKVGRTTVYRWRQGDEEFARNWDLAFDLSTQALEDEAIRRATVGNARPQYYQGRIVGHVREKSDLLLMFMLKGRRPDIYRDKDKMGAGPSHTQLRIAATLAYQQPGTLIDTLGEAARSADKLLQQHVTVAAAEPASSPAERRLTDAAPVDKAADPPKSET